MRPSLQSRRAHHSAPLRVPTGFRLQGHLELDLRLPEPGGLTRPPPPRCLTRALSSYPRGRAAKGPWVPGLGPAGTGRGARAGARRRGLWTPGAHVRAPAGVAARGGLALSAWERGRDVSTRRSLRPRAPSSGLSPHRRQRAPGRGAGAACALAAV